MPDLIAPTVRLYGSLDKSYAGYRVTRGSSRTALSTVRRRHHDHADARRGAVLVDWEAAEMPVGRDRERCVPSWPQCW